jgi:large subunit ribosomal protein L25
MIWFTSSMSTKTKGFCFHRPAQSVIINFMPQDSITLQLEKRETLGKAVKHLRTQGIIPAVIHDHGKPSLHVQGEKVPMLKVWQKAGKHHPVELSADGKKYVALIKDAEFDPKKHQLRHIVFNAVDANQEVEAEIPVRPRYAEGDESSPAEQNSLIVLAQLESVQVKAVPTKLPDVLEYDANKLVEVGDHITVADLNVPAGVEVLTEAEHSIATVYEPSALAAANDAAAGDAEAEDAENVESEHESSAEEGTQAAENRPGGKEQDEPKPSSIEAAKADS